jgi:hypothetical protein
LADVHVSGLETPDDEFPIFWQRSGIVASFPPPKTAIGSSPTSASVRHPIEHSLTFRTPSTSAGRVVLRDCIWIASPFTDNERKL